MRALSSIHPFPARMAPELARQSLQFVPRGGRVLDPMCGSGTVARAAVEAGFRCSGVDIDPLAVLMSRVWTTRLSPHEIRMDADRMVAESRALADNGIEHPVDPETARFVAYWFAPRQGSELARLATVLRRHCGPTADALAVALSRIIVSKEALASLARDTSHSRPHKVANTNDFNVYAGFLRSAEQVARRLEPELIKGEADIQCGDARSLADLEDGSFDLALTSPPYLNAIDYLRGHRLALVWLGYELRQLRALRAASVGAERSLADGSTPVDISRYVDRHPGSTIANRHLGWIRRYAVDMYAVLLELVRVVRRSGRVVLILGNSFLRGATVDNARLVEALARRAGLLLEARHVRVIPARRRYLPPPSDGLNPLDARMRKETVLTFSFG